MKGAVKMRRLLGLNSARRSAVVAMTLVSLGTASALTAETTAIDRIAGDWTGAIFENGENLRVKLSVSGSGELEFTAASCTVAKSVDRVTDVSLTYVFGPKSVRFCGNDPVVVLTIGSDNMLGMTFTDPKGRLPVVSVTLSRAGATEHSAVAETDPESWRIFVKDRSQFRGEVRSEPRYQGGPRRSYIVDINFVGDQPIMRFYQHETSEKTSCLGSLQFQRLSPQESAEFVFSRMAGRGDIIMDCPDGVPVTLTRVAGDLRMDWIPRENEPVSGVLSDLTAQRAAESAAANAAAAAAVKAAATAARNADPCTHTVWDGVQVNIADTFLCDEGRAIALFRAGSAVDLSVTEVAYSEGRLKGTAGLTALSGKGNLTVICVFPEDDNFLFSSGDTISVDASLSDYSKGRLTLECTQRD